MSGRKQVTIYEDEYRRLLADTRRLRELESHLPEVLEAVRRENMEELRRRLEPLERRQREFLEVVEGLAEEVRAWETETARRLEAYQRQMRDALRDVRQAIAEQGRRLGEWLEQERRARQKQIQDLQRQIDALVGDQVRKRELARAWLQAARAIGDFIGGHYRHERFAPGRLERLRRVLWQAEENLGQGAAEAALAQAQGAYQELSDLRLELERLEGEWQMWRGAALESVREVLALARQHRQCRAVGLDGRELDREVEVDFWTEGKLSALERELQAVIARIEDEDCALSTEELRGVVEREVPRFRERLEEVVREARLACLGSQLRANIADLVVQALEEQGFRLEDGAYEGEDMRGSFVAKVVHPDGSEVVVVVMPKEGDPAGNDLQIHSFDAAQRSEEELKGRAGELARALEAKGLRVGEPQVVGEARPDPAWRDIRRVRRQPVGRGRRTV